MAKQHPFTPITNHERLERAIDYVAVNAVKLSCTVLGRELDLDTICFFAHAPEELVFLREAVLARGPQSRFTHGVTLNADTDFMVRNWHIKILGVRDVVSPDAHRTQIGYGDYPVTDFEQLVKTTGNNPHVKLITSGQGLPLIELRHPSFDVLGFVADESSHYL